MSLRFWPALVAFLLAGPLAAQPLPGATTPPAAAARAEAAYDAARGLFDGGLYAPAARAFAAFREAYPRDIHEPQALFYQAEATLASGDDVGAADLFASFERDYPVHPFASQARLALDCVLLEMVDFHVVRFERGHFDLQIDRGRRQTRQTVAREGLELE